MIQRLRDALRRGRSAELPDRQYRPNELRLETVRADRVRREARRAEPAVRQPSRSPEELQERRPRESASAPAAQPRSVPRQIALLKTRSGLRQAWLLKEILEPPLALRSSYNDDHDR